MSFMGWTNEQNKRGIRFNCFALYATDSQILSLYSLRNATVIVKVAYMHTSRLQPY